MLWVRTFSLLCLFRQSEVFTVLKNQLIVGTAKCLKLFLLEGLKKDRMYL